MVNQQDAVLTDIGRLAAAAHHLGMLDLYARVQSIRCWPILATLKAA